MMKRKLENVLITGGAGFIGSNFIHYIFKNTDFVGNIINVDKLTYAVNCDKIKRDLEWIQQYTFEEGLDLTIKWYMENQNWVERVRGGEYRQWMEKNYKMR